MEALPQLVPRRLIQMSPIELIDYYRTITAAASPEHHLKIIAHIRTQVHIGAIPPQIFEIWLPLMLHRFPQLLKSILVDPGSQHIRKSGLKTLARLLRTRQRERVWNAIGGAAGVYEIFQVVWSTKARLLASVVGRQMRASNLDQEVDLLVQALIFDSSLIITDPENQGTKRRFAFEDVSSLLQACSESFIMKLLSNPSDLSFFSTNLLNDLAKSRTNLFRQISVGITGADPSVRVRLLKDLPAELLYSGEPYTMESINGLHVSESAPPGLRYCVDLVLSLQIRPVKDKEPSNYIVFDWALKCIKRAIRRKTLFGDILTLLQTVTEVVSQREGDLRNISGPFTVYLAHFWGIATDLIAENDIDMRLTHGNRNSKCPSRPAIEHKDQLEELLVRFIRSSSREEVTPQKVSSVFAAVVQEDLLGLRFPGSAKLKFLKLLCFYAPGIEVNLEASPPSKDHWGFFSWDIEILDGIPAKDAEWLLAQISSLGLVGSTIESSYSQILRENALPSYWEKWLKVKWEAEDTSSEDDSPITTQILEEFIKQAETQRDAEQRKRLALQAIDIAIQSKSVRLLGRVSKWTSRFLRDPLVYPALTRLLWSANCSHLLSCTNMPAKRRPSSLPALKAFVQETNSIITSHIDTKLIALREPSCSCYFGDLDSQLNSVVWSRIRGVERFCKLGLATEEELVEVLLRSMVPILLQYEAMEIKEGSTFSLLCEDTNPKRKYALTFLDDLARRRDELWASQRRIQRPEAAALEPGWPKGLPVQSLLPSKDWAIAALKDKNAAPYVARRFQEVLFCEPDIAFSQVPHETRGIGKFVDSLAFVIDAYCVDDDGKKDIDKIVEVWEYYKGILPSQSRVDKLFRRCLSERFDNQKVRSMLNPPALCMLPGSSDSTELDLEEWNPCPWALVPSTGMESSDETPITILECRLSAPELPGYASHLYEFEKPNSNIFEKARSALDIWPDGSRFSRLPLANREAVVLSALLFLDTLTGKSPGILSKPFPQGAYAPRYPALYLDYEFLSAASEDSRVALKAVGILTKLKSMVPPELLRNLASSLLEKTRHSTEKPSDTSDWILEHTKFQLIKLLARSDRPETAIDLGLHVLEHMPDSSSWHRSVISLGLIQQLDFVAAEKMLKRIASFVLSSLQKRKQNKRLQDDQDDATTFLAKSTSEPQHIKITTIKLLVRLIGDTGLFSSRAAVQILEDLFHASHHIDVRDPVVTALFTLLNKSVGLDGRVSYEIYKKVTSFYRVAAAPSERFDLSETDWANAETGGPLPEINSERPLLSHFIEKASEKIPRSLHEKYVREVVLPLLDESTRQHNRWMRILLGRVGLTPEQSLPCSNFGPFDSDAEDDVLFRWSNYLPKNYLFRHRSWAMRFLDCCKLGPIQQKLQNQDQNWKDTNAGRHLYEWIDKGRNHQVFNITFGKKESRVSDGFTQHDVEDEFYERAKLVLCHPIHMNHDGRLSPSLKPIRSVIYYLISRRFYDHAVERDRRAQWLLNRIATYADDLRTASWLTDSNRQPAILPPPMEFQALLLPFPHLQGSTEEAYDAFTRRVRELAHKCSVSHACTDEFERYLKPAVLSVLQNDKLQCAVRIGRLSDDDHGSAAANLMVMLSMALLETLNKATIAKSEAVKVMLNNWAASPCEWLRTAAWQQDEKDDTSHVAMSTSCRW